MTKINQILDLLLAIVGDIGVIDIIDILAISYVVYRILVFIEDTRAFNLLKGLGIIFLTYIITKEFSLNTVNAILESLLPTSIIALIIIFQPELRRGLEDLGKRSFLHEHRSTKSEIKEISNEITKSLLYCSKKRTGVLIVIEQEIGLKDFIDNGTTIHAKITTELLNNIFYWGTPLHDGAVIIKSNLIESAGSMLPVTNNHKAISKDLGTRHRAAVGVTEMTDSIVFLVSEETGAIRKVQYGEIKDIAKDKDSVDEYVKETLEKEVFKALEKAAKFEQENKKEDKKNIENKQAINKEEII